MEEIDEREGCFRKLSCLEKRKNELTLQETHSWNNILQVKISWIQYSTSYHEGSLAYLYLHKQAAELVTRTHHVAAM